MRQGQAPAPQTHNAANSRRSRRPGGGGARSVRRRDESSGRRWWRRSYTTHASPPSTRRKPDGRSRRIFTARTRPRGGGFAVVESFGERGRRVIRRSNTQTHRHSHRTSLTALSSHLRARYLTRDRIHCLRREAMSRISKEKRKHVCQHLYMKRKKRKRLYASPPNANRQVADIKTSHLKKTLRLQRRARESSNTMTKRRVG